MRIRALLDHPWALHENFDRTSQASRVLDQFDDLIREYGLKPVPFVKSEELNDARAAAVLIGRQAKAVWFRITNQLVIDSLPQQAATVEGAVPRLSEHWRRALNHEMIDRNWRNPQIIVPSTRRAHWPTVSEVAVRYGASLQEAEERVVLAPLEIQDYERHPYAAPDGDPWDMRCRAHANLPKPPSVRLRGLEDIIRQLPESGETSDRSFYYFVPTHDWSPDLIEKLDWRAGRTFFQQQSWNNKGAGPVDVDGRVWVIDFAHAGRHWDVQPSDKYDQRAMDAKYWRVLPDGRLQRRN